MVHFLIRKWYTFKLVYTSLHLYLLFTFPNIRPFFCKLIVVEFLQLFIIFVVPFCFNDTIIHTFYNVIYS